MSRRHDPKKQRDEEGEGGRRTAEWETRDTVVWLFPRRNLASPAQMAIVPQWTAPLLHAVALASLTNSFRLLNLPGPIKDFTDSQYGGHFVFLTVQG